MKKKIVLSLISLLVIVFVFEFINDFKNSKINLNRIERLIPQHLKEKMLNTVFAFKYVKLLKNDLEKKDYEFQDFISSPNISINFKFIKKKETEKREIYDNKLLLKKFELPFLKDSGQRAYLNYHDNNLFFISGSGILMFASKEKIFNEDFTFKKINTNFNDVVGEKYVLTNKPIVRHFFIKNNKIYISFNKNPKEDCYYNEILVGDLNYENIILKEFFSVNECQPEFSYAQGGKFSDYKDGKFLFSIGDHESYERNVAPTSNPQNIKSLIGKIIAIDEQDKKFRIVSMGHRNPQGLFYDKENDIIYSTEHGPKGGDEININTSPNDEKIENYGWAISSYGDHYEINYEIRNDKETLFKRAPLHKSHSLYGFIEPLKYFVPSIAPTQILKIDKFIKIENKNILYVSTIGVKNDPERGHMSVHQFIFDADLKIESHNIIPIGARVRDMIYIKEINKILLFLEDIQSIATLELAKN